MIHTAPEKAPACNFLGMKRQGNFQYQTTRPAKQQKFVATKSAPRRIGPNSKATYQTVPRTKGVYAQGELKYFDTDLFDKAIPASADWTATEMDPATFLTLFDPVQGNGIAQRIGQKAQIHKIKVKGSVQVPQQTNQTTSKAAAAVRIILFQDMQTNATQAQGEELMADAGTAAKNINSFQNFNNFGRFRVWKDKMLVLEDPNMAFDGTNIEVNGLIKKFKFNLNFSRDPIPVRFNATSGGTIADIVDNSFHMLAITNNASGLVPNLTYNCRVAFKG